VENKIEERMKVTVLVRETPRTSGRAREWEKDWRDGEESWKGWESSDLWGNDPTQFEV